MTSSSVQNSVSRKGKADSFERREILPKNHYFDNEKVERLLCRYLQGACTDVGLRDEIMVCASELIRQVMKAHNLSQICPGKDDSSINDLFQTAWLQIEGALYKFEARPHCSCCYNNMRPNDSLLCDEFIFPKDLVKRHSKCPHCRESLTIDTIYYRGLSKVFNMFSQIARTVILAYIKKENRDRKNHPVFQTHVRNKIIPKSDVLERFLTEAREICKYNNDHMLIVETIEKLYETDEKPHEGLITKLVERTNLPRSTITEFLHLIRARSFEFSDSPINEEFETIKHRYEDVNSGDRDYG